MQIRAISGAFDKKNLRLNKQTLRKDYTINREISDIADIIFVNPKNFDITKTTNVALEITEFNKKLAKENRKYLLI